MLSSSTSVALIFLTFTIATVAAKEFLVGDDVGWRIPASNETELYTVWASRRRFHIGDSLRFQYKNDSVVLTVKWLFHHCDASQPISIFTDGDTVINLERTGRYFFISGHSDRCNKGQKMMVNVMKRHQFLPSSATPPTISPSPSQLYGSGASSDFGPAVSVSVVSFVVAVAGLWLCFVQP
ncbi:hypothetical protein L2E82_16649 [Cichorium intybus]|uniref:Uncharacterized protein n=1 Tax=Cichorium intybus TaxID=13427 RepID=A0ACB9F6N9_CICIN|nr:hypothetical protein L2E82_16649 [Cichorium intybus]